MLKRSHPRQSAGITLIELMIALVIVAILLMAGLPSFSQWIQNIRNRSAAESILNGLQMARAEAIKRNATVSFVLTDNRGSWTVGCDPVIEENAGTGAIACPALLDQRAVSAESSLNVDANELTTFTFNNLGRRTVPAAGEGINVPINVSSTMTSLESRALRVTVSIGGEARMCDPSVTDATDVRICP